MKIKQKTVFFSFVLLLSFCFFSSLLTAPAFADPATTKVKCKDGKTVTAKKNAAAPNNILDAKDYAVACKGHKGYAAPTDKDKDKDKDKGGGKKDDKDKGSATGPFNLSTSDLGLENSSGDQAALKNILNGVYLIAGGVAVLMIVISGLLMVVNGDNPQNVATARKSVIFTAVGLVVVVMAFVITNVVLAIV